MGNQWTDQSTKSNSVPSEGEATSAGARRLRLAVLHTYEHTRGKEGKKRKAFFLRRHFVYAFLLSNFCCKTINQTNNKICTQVARIGMDDTHPPSASTHDPKQTPRHE